MEPKPSHTEPSGSELKTIRVVSPGKEISFPTETMRMPELRIGHFMHEVIDTELQKSIIAFLTHYILSEKKTVTEDLELAEKSTLLTERAINTPDKELRYLAAQFQSGNLKKNDLEVALYSQYLAKPWGEGKNKYYSWNAIQFQWNILVEKMKAINQQVETAIGLINTVHGQDGVAKFPRGGAVIDGVSGSVYSAEITNKLQSLFEIYISGGIPKVADDTIDSTGKFREKVDFTLVRTLAALRSEAEPVRSRVTQDIQCAATFAVYEVNEHNVDIATMGDCTVYALQGGELVACLETEDIIYNRWRDTIVDKGQREQLRSLLATSQTHNSWENFRRAARRILLPQSKSVSQSPTQRAKGFLNGVLGRSDTAYSSETDITIYDEMLRDIFDHRSFTRAFGANEPDLNAQFGQYSVNKDTKAILAVSDGLLKHLSKEQIVKIIRAGIDKKAKPQTIVDSILSMITNPKDDVSLSLSILGEGSIQILPAITPAPRDSSEPTKEKIEGLDFEQTKRKARVLQSSKFVSEKTRNLLESLLAVSDGNTESNLERIQAQLLEHIKTAEDEQHQILPAIAPAVLDSSEPIKEKIEGPDFEQTKRKARLLQSSKFVSEKTRKALEWLLSVSDANTESNLVRIQADFLKQIKAAEDERKQIKASLTGGYTEIVNGEDKRLRNRFGVQPNMLYFAEESSQDFGAKRPQNVADIMDRFSPYTWKFIEQPTKGNSVDIGVTDQTRATDERLNEIALTLKGTDFTICRYVGYGEKRYLVAASVGKSKVFGLKANGSSVTLHESTSVDETNTRIIELDKDIQFVYTTSSNLTSENEMIMKVQATISEAKKLFGFDAKKIAQYVISQSKDLNIPGETSAVFLSLEQFDSVDADNALKNLDQMQTPEGFLDALKKVASYDLNNQGGGIENQSKKLVSEYYTSFSEIIISLRTKGSPLNRTFLESFTLEPDETIQQTEERIYQQLQQIFNRITRGGEYKIRPNAVRLFTQEVLKLKKEHDNEVASRL